MILYLLSHKKYRSKRRPIYALPYSSPWILRWAGLKFDKYILGAYDRNGHL